MQLSSPPSNFVKLAVKTASASATIDFTSVINSGYKHYLLSMSTVQPSVNTSIGVKFSSDNGATWVISLQSQKSTLTLGGATAPTYAGVSAATLAPITDTITTQMSGWAFLNPIYCAWRSSAISGGANAADTVIVSVTSLTCNAFQLVPASGTINTGSFTLYGAN